MVREIVSIQVGECGNNIGSKFWDMISREHGLNLDGAFIGSPDIKLDKIKVYFNESREAKFIPRSIFVDLEKDGLNNAKSSEYGKIFKSTNMICGELTHHSNWGSGFYTIGAEIIDSIIDIIRKEAELCDSLQGFQLFNSLGGGTGSGVGSLILNNLKDEYPDQILTTFSVFPSPKMANIVIDPYNCVLSLNELISKSGQVFYFDNDELYDIAYKKLKLFTPTFGDLNYIVTCGIAGATCSLRFPNLQNSDLRKMSLSLIPFDRLKFLKSTFQPTMSRGSTQYFYSSAKDLVSTLFNEKDEVFLGASVNFNGRFDVNDVIEQMEVVNSNIDIDIKSSICPIFIENHCRSATLIKNSTSFINMLNRQHFYFQKLYLKRAYIHIFECEGVDKVEFDLAERNLIDLIQVYEAYKQVDE